jgi:hypothetical protein
MKKKITLFSILILVFSLLIWFVFGDFIKLFFKYNDFKPISHSREKLFVNKWVIDKAKTEDNLRRNYPNGYDSLTLEQLIYYRKIFIDSASLNIFEDGHYEQRVKGFSTLEIIGEWYNEDQYLVLTEKNKNNSLKPILTSAPDDLITYYFQVVKNNSNELILFLDLEKNRNIPSELKAKKSDTVFYAPSTSRY